MSVWCCDGNPNCTNFYFEGIVISDVVMGDIDGEGHNELILTSYGSDSSGQIRIIVFCCGMMKPNFWPKQS